MDLPKEINNGVIYKIHEGVKAEARIACEKLRRINSLHASLDPATAKCQPCNQKRLAAFTNSI